MGSRGNTTALNRSIGQSVGIQTGTHTDYSVIKEYEQIGTAQVLNVIRNASDVNKWEIGSSGAPIGSIKFHPLAWDSSNQNIAYPKNANINQYPAEGEYVSIVRLGGDGWDRLFYEAISNSSDVTYNGNTSLHKKRWSESINRSAGLRGSVLAEDEQFVSNTSSFRSGFQFKLSPLTSDLIIQSKFGSNIRMTDIDSESSSATSPTLIISNNISPAANAKIEETLNGQGSFIILTSGNEYDGFKPLVYDEFISTPRPPGNKSAFETSTSFRVGSVANRANGGFIQDKLEYNTHSFKTEFNGDRLILSSNAIINQSTVSDILNLSSGNLIMYSKRKTSIDAMKGMDINTNQSSFRVKSNELYLTSPNVYLGYEGDRSQPAILGENLLQFLELFIGALKQNLELKKIFETASYTSPGEGETTDNLVKALGELLKGGKIPQDMRRILLSDKVFVAPNRIDPTIDPPVRNQTEQ